MASIRTLTGQSVDNPEVMKKIEVELMIEQLAREKVAKLLDQQKQDLRDQAEREVEMRHVEASKIRAEREQQKKVEAESKIEDRPADPDGPAAYTEAELESGHWSDIKDLVIKHGGEPFSGPGSKDENIKWLMANV